MRISATRMTSDVSTHFAAAVPGAGSMWRVSWLPGRLLDRNRAVTAMMLAEVASKKPPRLLVDTWATELDLTGADAARLVSQPPEDSGDGS
jgi:hypothetical protein